MKCPLCEREGDLAMERHHLRTRRKDADAVEKICRECHKTIHGLFTQRQLRDDRLGLDTVDGLLADERVRKAVDHIRRLPPGTQMRMREARTKRRRS